MNGWAARSRCCGATTGDDMPKLELRGQVRSKAGAWERGSEEAASRTLIRGRFDQSEIAAAATVKNVHAGAPGIEKNEELPVRHFELQNGLVHEHRFDGQPFGPDDGVPVILVFLDRLGMQHLFLEMLHDVFSRSMFSHQARF